MKLLNNTLTSYFNFKFNKDSKGNQVTWCPYNFVDNKNKRNLVITIGDSWTWGADICEGDETEQRLKDVFGSIVANELSADFLNLGQSGSCNLHIIQRIQELKIIIPLLKYEKIFIICVYTEVCRSLDGPYDRKVDYVAWFQHNNFQDILKYHNSLFQHELIELEILYPHVKLLIGTNFVEPIGMDPQLTVLSKNWIEVYNEQVIQREYLKPCYVMSHWVFDKIRDFIISFNPKVDRDNLDIWMIGLLEKAKDRKEFTMNPTYFKGISHPLKLGHKVWAEYILENI